MIGASSDASMELTCSRISSACFRKGTPVSGPHHKWWRAHRFPVAPGTAQSQTSSISCLPACLPRGAGTGKPLRASQGLWFESGSPLETHKSRCRVTKASKAGKSRERYSHRFAYDLRRTTIPNKTNSQQCALNSLPFVVCFIL